MPPRCEGTSEVLTEFPRGSPCSCCSLHKPSPLVASGEKRHVSRLGVMGCKELHQAGHQSKLSTSGLHRPLGGSGRATWYKKTSNIPKRFDSSWFIDVWLHNFRTFRNCHHAGLLGLAQFCESSACENNCHFPSYKPVGSMPN